MAERAVAERTNTFVETGTDPRDLGLGDAGVDAHRSDQIIDGAGRDSGHVGLHHDRVQGLVDAPARFENGREEAAFAELGDSELQIAGLGRQRLGAVPVALIQTFIDALISARADGFGCFGFDQFLEHPAGDLADQIDAFADAERVEQVGQVRIGQSHRCVLLDVVLAGTHQESRRWLTYWWTSQTHHLAGLYTSIWVCSDDLAPLGAHLSTMGPNQLDIPTPFVRRGSC